MPRARLVAVPLLAGLLPFNASALGLGEITLRSALNQPFNAEIPVTAAGAEELEGLSVQLAPIATFERFGLDRPRFLDDLRFSVDVAGGAPVVRISSTSPVGEPFVSLLLDVSWPAGRLLREYTVLLDPPAFSAPEAADAPSPVGVRAPEAVGSEPSPAPIARSAPAMTGGPVDSYGPVQSNETLWGIAERLRAQDGASLNQMMLALYRANPEAFAGNINRLKRGAILRVPRGAALDELSAAAATAEVQRQDAEWRASLGAAPPTEPRLQLVPPDESASSATAPGTPAPQLERELAENRRLLTLKDQQLLQLQERVRQLEGASTPAPAPAPPATPAAPPAEPSADAPVERLPGEEPLADTPAAEAASVDAEAGAAEERRQRAREVRERRVARDEGGGSFLDTMKDIVFNTWFLVAAAIVLLAGLFLVFARRRMAGADDVPGRFGNDLRGGGMMGGAAATARASNDGYSVEEGAEAADRTQSTPVLSRGPSVRPQPDAETPLEKTISTEGAVELDQADVIAEAEFHMAYGLYDQAADLLNRALRDAPDRRDLRLKLLEVYFIWENKASFLKDAQVFSRQFGASGTDPDWNKVLIMGKQICPDEPLFAGAVVGGDAGGLDLALADDQGVSVDFSLDAGDDKSLDLDLTGARRGPADDLLDFNLGDADSGAPTQIAEPTPRTGEYSPTMETPTLESPALERTAVSVPTVETPTIETNAASTIETPTLESAISGLRQGPGRRDAGDNTEEINLDELGLDLTGLDEAAGELGTDMHPATDASGVMPALETDATAEMQGMALDEGTLDLPAFGAVLEKSQAGRDGTETAAHRVLDDTAEQPQASRLAGGRLGDESAELSAVDFDLGEAEVEDLEPTSVMTGRRGPGEAPTMTEVGTKLDLARAYVDMGDPDGARSILNEVLEEGDSAQRQEARKLLDDLAD
jgi:pilus assembly protein FimV